MAKLLSGTRVYGNLTIDTFATATGNITGGNLVTAGQISAVGNITGDYLFGNGSQLTGIDATSIQNGTANVRTFPNGNVTTSAAGVANVLTVTSTGAIVSGTMDVSGNLSAGNVSAAQLTATGGVDAAVINTDAVTSGSTLTLTASDLVMALTGNIDMNQSLIRDLGAPQSSSDAATKQYVDDAVSSGIHIHDPVLLETPTALPAATYAQGGTVLTVTDTVAGNTVVFSTAANLQVNDQLWFSNSFQGVVANLSYFVVSAPNTSAAVLSTVYNGEPVANITSASTLSQSVRVNPGIGATLTATANGALTVDSVSVSNNDRVLVYNQAVGLENGVYTVTQTGNVSAPWILTRATDADQYVPNTNDGIDQGSYFFVQSGATGAGESYVMTSPTGPFIIGFDAIEFTQFSSSQVYTANTEAGIALSGTVFSARTDSVTTDFDAGGNIRVRPGAVLTTPNIGAATGTSLTLTGNVQGGNLVTTGAVTGNGRALTSLNASNLDFGTVPAARLSGTYSITVSGAATTAGTVTTAAQPNITSLGSLSSVTVTGNATIGNVNATTAVVVSGVEAATSTVTGSIRTAGGVGVAGNVYVGGLIETTGNIRGGNLLTSAVSISQTGAITGVSIISASGNANVGNIGATNGVFSAAVTAGTTVVATGNITGGNLNTAGAVVVSGTGAATSTLTGSIRTAGGLGVQGNAYVGGLMSVTGNLTAGNISVTNISGTLSTASQTNITGVGTITAGTWQGNSISTTYTDAKVTSVNGSVGAVTGLATTGGTLAQFAATTSSQLAGVISDETGSGNLVFNTSPTLVTPVLGAATGTSLALTGGSLTTRAAVTQDGVVIAGRAGGTGTWAVTVSPTTLSANRTLTLANGDTVLQAGTMATTGGTLAQFAATTSSQLAGVISDETGSGSLVFATSPTLVTPVLGAATGTSLALTGGSLTTRAAATQDGVIISGRAGGTTTRSVTITPTTLSASRTLTLPDNSGTVLTTGATVTVAQGGTGQSTLTANNVLLGNGTSAVQVVAPGTNGNVLTSNGSTWVSSAPGSTGVSTGKAIALSIIFNL